MRFLGGVTIRPDLFDSTQQACGHAGICHPAIDAVRRARSPAGRSYVGVGGVSDVDVGKWHSVTGRAQSDPDSQALRRRSRDT